MNKHCHILLLTAVAFGGTLHQVLLPPAAHAQGVWDPTWPPNLGNTGNCVVINGNVNCVPCPPANVVDCQCNHSNPQAGNTYVYCSGSNVNCNSICNLKP